MGYFKRTRAGKRIVLDEVEAAVLTQVIGEMAVVIGAPDDAEISTSEAPDGAAAWAHELGLSGVGDESSAPSPPSDPVRARLFPDGYRDDAEAASDFRRFTERDLRAGKAANAEAMLKSLPEGGGTIVLDADGCAAWLGALNDARLALGTALEVDESTSFELASLDAGDPRARRLLVYQWLGELQDSLLRALMRG